MNGHADDAPPSPTRTDVRRACALAAHRIARDRLGERVLLDEANTAGAGAGLAVGVAEVLRLLVAEYPAADAQALIRANRERRGGAVPGALVKFTNDDLRRADDLLRAHLGDDYAAARAVLAEAAAERAVLPLAAAALHVLFELAPGLDSPEGADSLRALVLAEAAAEADPEPEP